MNKATLLKAIKKDLTHKGWVQNIFRSSKGSCLMGSILRVLPQADRVEGSYYEDLLIKLLSLETPTQETQQRLSDFIRHHETQILVPHDLLFKELCLTVYNDLPSTTLSDILSLLDRAQADPAPEQDPAL